MSKLYYILFAIISLAFIFSSCTENQRARTFGGTTTINVEKGKKVTMATWKEENIFYMVEDMDSGYIPKDKELIESSSFGIIESKIVFHESN